VNDWSSPLALGAAETVLAVVLAVALVLLVVLAVALRRSRRQTREALARAEAERAELAARLDELERPALASRAPEAVSEFVITDVGDTPRTPAEPAARIEGRLFADIVLRESVVKAASWTYGVRTALSAENRNRLGFEMRRETKRSAKQRRADVKEALRQYYERQRGDLA